MPYTHIIAVTAISMACVSVAEGQSRIRVESPRRQAEQLLESRAFGYSSDRPQLGIAVTTTGAGDTLGVLVDDVTRESPAERAGIKEGDRLQSINGTSLRLSAADAGAEDMQGIATRRLIRELEKMKVGDEATLGVYRDGRALSLKVTTVSAADLSPVRTALRRMDSDRAALGFGMGVSGSRRDTAGVLITSVVDDGPADKARIEEGDRIASINGVDLRVPREDAGDLQASSTRLRRFYREIEGLKVGDQVELRLVRVGQTRTVKVTAVASSALPRSSNFSFSIGEGAPNFFLRGPDDVRSFAFPRDGSDGGVYFFDRDGGERKLEIEGRLRDLMQRYEGSDPAVRRFRIRTPAPSGS